MSEESPLLHDYIGVLISASSETQNLEGKKRQNQATCIICRFWVGRCLKGRVGKIAASDACESFQKRVISKNSSAKSGNF